MIHYVEKLKFMVTDKSTVTLCGLSFDNGDSFAATNNILAVNCKDCKEAYSNQKGIIKEKQTLCSFCDTTLSTADYEDKNAFYLACHNHKLLAEIETKKYFKKNPDYTGWGKKESI